MATTTKTTATTVVAAESIRENKDVSNPTVTSASDTVTYNTVRLDFKHPLDYETAIWVVQRDNPVGSERDWFQYDGTSKKLINSETEIS